MVSSPDSEHLLYFNGINAISGDYALPPMTAAALAKIIQINEDPDFIADLQQSLQVSFIQAIDVDPTNLADMGWGIIFTTNAHPAIKEALTPLLDLRHAQATAQTDQYFKIFEGSDGYRPGETKNQFLARHGVGLGPVDPAQGVPYYLLLVGDLNEIPYEFQRQLSLRYAVGRIHFDTLADYARYAQSVVAAETEDLSLAPEASFFSTAHPQDRFTQLATQKLIDPLSAELQNYNSAWTVERVVADQATQTQLTQLLGGPSPPTLLFTAGHGMVFPADDPRRQTDQGTILCQDWPGPEAWQQSIPPAFYFTGEDLPEETNLVGTVIYHYHSYGAGVLADPLFPPYPEAQKSDSESGSKAPTRPAMANLPKKLLAHGALAVLSYTSRVWGYAFAADAEANITTLANALDSISLGDPVGLAFEDTNIRLAEVALDLIAEMEEVEYRTRRHPNQAEAYLSENCQKLVRLWSAYNDARHLMLIGDPAARLPLAEPDQPPTARPAITVDLARFPDAPLEARPDLTPSPIKGISDVDWHNTPPAVQRYLEKSADLIKSLKTQLDQWPY